MKVSGIFRLFFFAFCENTKFGKIFEKVFVNSCTVFFSSISKFSSFETFKFSSSLLDLVKVFFLLLKTCKTFGLFLAKLCLPVAFPLEI